MLCVQTAMRTRKEMRNGRHFTQKIPESFGHTLQHILPPFWWRIDIHYIPIITASLSLSLCTLMKWRHCPSRLICANSWNFLPSSWTKFPLFFHSTWSWGRGPKPRSMQEEKMRTRYLQRRERRGEREGRTDRRGAERERVKYAVGSIFSSVFASPWKYDPVSTKLNIFFLFLRRVVSSKWSPCSPRSLAHLAQISLHHHCALQLLWRIQTEGQIRKLLLCFYLLKKKTTTVRIP